MGHKLTGVAAVLMIAATLVTLSIDRQMATVAHASEKSQEPNNGLRSIHIRIEPAGSGMSEAWAQFDDQGKLLRLRMSFPNTEDGAKEVVWQDDKAAVWFKTKNAATVVHEKEILKKFPELLAALDPKVAMEQLQAAQAKGDAVIETRSGNGKGEPIKLVATFKKTPNKRLILRINPQSKLVEQIENFELKNGKYKLVSRHEYADHNQAIPADVFALNIPLDATRVDTTTQDIGLPKGTLSDKEIAAKVAREFFDALIAKDYAKAGILYSGTSAAKMQELFGKIEFLRIISVGDPTPHPDARTQFLQVPCEVEIRVEDQTIVQKFLPNIRAVYNQPDRWAVQGGV